MTDQPSGVPPPPASGDGDYPISLEYQRGPDVQNWRPLVNWLLAIPHLVVLYGLGIAAGVLWIVSFFTVLFTKRNPFVGFQAMVLRYQWRVLAYFHFMQNEYPPFEFSTTATDAGADAASVSVRDPGEMNRWLVLVKWLFAIPSEIVVAILAIGAWFVTIYAFFVVLFTGKWPEGARNYVVGVYRWHTRVTGYVLFVTDAYPPFRLEP